MQLLGSAKFRTEDENPKEKVKFLKRGGGGANFLKGGDFPRNFAPREGDITRNFEIPGTRYSIDNDMRMIRVSYRYRMLRYTRAILYFTRSFLFLLEK